MKRKFFKISFVARAQSRQEAERSLQENDKLEICHGSLKIEDSQSPHVEVMMEKGREQILKSRDYLHDLENFYHEAELVCAEFSVANPYTKTIQKALKKQDLNSEDKQRIESLEKFAHHAGTLSKIKRFLVDLPDGDEFEDLRFRKSLLEINLDLPKALQKPERLDKSVMQAFEDFQKVYAKKYLKMLQERSTFLKEFWRGKDEIERKLLALETLESIDFLKVEKGRFETLKKNYANLKKEFPFKEIPLENVRKVLEKNPAWENIFFTSPSCQEACEKFSRKLDQSLEEKFSQIKTTGVLKILKGSKQGSVQKLVGLLSLASLKKIVTVFNKKTAPAIAHELSKLLSPESVDILRLGDFSSKVKEISSKGEAESLVAEFKSFLEKKVKKQKRVILK